MTKQHHKAPVEVLETLSRMVCLYAHEKGLRIAVAISFDTDEGASCFTAFGNTSQDETAHLFKRGVKLVTSSEPSGYFNHKADQ